MCGYVYDRALTSPSTSDLVAQFEKAMAKASKFDRFMVKIFTSGSFLDEKEVPLDARSSILSTLEEDSRVFKVVVESRPEFLTNESMKFCLDHLKDTFFEVAIGLETSSDFIRKHSINKGFTFRNYVQAAEIAKAHGVALKTYLLLKPPLLSEKQALEDILASVKDASVYSRVFSINLCNVQKGTLVEYLWERGEYRLFVDENAKVGTGNIDLYYKADDGDAWFKKTVSLRVGSNTFDSKGTIQLSEISSDPAVFMPGDRGTVSFTLRNTATTSTVTIDGQEYDTNARVQSASLRGIDGITVTSDSYSGSGIIGPGDSITLNYNIRIDNNTEDGTYYLDFFMVGNSHAYNNNWRIPVRVDSSAVKVIPSKPLTLTDGEGVFEFDVANSHPNTFNSVSVRLVSDDIAFSPEEYYIGSMNADELFTIQIKARDSGNGSSSPVTIEVDYKNGVNSHSDMVGVRNVNTVQSDSGNTSTLALTFIGLALLVGLPAVALYRRKKQSNK
ncbi:MAG: hypothetical protein PWP14_1511 [Methanolobus sp.]|nr:hypothetical protein [Methanolobus sp.]